MVQNIEYRVPTCTILFMYISLVDKIEMNVIKLSMFALQLF